MFFGVFFTDIKEIKCDIQKENRISAIENTIITKKQLSFDDIAGLHDAKEALHEAIIMPLKFPHLFTGIQFSYCHCNAYQKLFLKRIHEIIF